MKVILIGGHPKGFNEPFHINTKSGQVLRKILDRINIDPVIINLWKNQKEEDSRVISDKTKSKLKEFESKGYVLVSLGRYIEKALLDNKIKSHYLPHPASRDYKYIKILEEGLLDLSST